MTRTKAKCAPGPTATYVFAVARGCEPSALAAAAGQPGGGPLRLLRFGSLDAVVQDVPAHDFGADVLRERLAERAALEQCARAHHAVVTKAAEAGPALPLPLATLYLDDERAVTALSREEDRFHAALGRIADRVEWGVQLYATRTPAPHTPAAPVATSAATRDRPGQARPGHAYLDRLRGARREREQRQEAGLRAAETVDSALRAVAVASRRLRTHGTSDRPESGTQLLNAAYLVPRERRTVVAEVVERLRGSAECRHVEVRVTGPWVPYSFVEEIPDAGG